MAVCSRSAKLLLVQNTSAVLGDYLSWGGHDLIVQNVLVVTSSFHAADFEACLKAFQEASVLFSRHPSHSVTLTPATAQSAVPSIVNREYNNDYQSLLSLSHNIYIF